MNRRKFLKIGSAAGLSAAMGGGTAIALPAGLPDADARKLPRWRGFNLLEKFTVGGNAPYRETDFAWMAEWGFNFARLPLDYRCWAPTPDAAFDEQALLEIDQAIGWGTKYGIHISLNFHRGPGYCVNPPRETGDLWTEPAMQDLFARHWAVFAKRYQGIPSRQLSFNLINEPHTVEDAVYAAAMKPAIEGIHGADSRRLIIADGLSWGTVPSRDLIPFGVAQSTRGYAPFELTHYMAPWVSHPGESPVPVWPIPAGMNSYLFGNSKPDLQSPLLLQVQCPRKTEFRIRVDRVSVEAELVVKADGILVFQHLFKPGPGEGEWEKSEANEWGGYNGDYGRDYSAEIPAGTREIEIGVAQGDWLKFSGIQLGELSVRPTNHEWGEKQEGFILSSGGLKPAGADRFSCSRNILQQKLVAPWMQLAAEGVGVHVGEWGVFNLTPHAVALAWMQDCLENWRGAGFGWALWNFRGSFGILDSGRKDVKYENFKGHQLDRQMLDLLRAS